MIPVTYYAKTSDGMRAAAWIDARLRERRITYAEVCSRMEDKDIGCVADVAEAIVAEMLGYPSWSELVSAAIVCAAANELKENKLN